MARPAKFSEEQILDAALDLIAQAGPPAATIAAIAERIGAPVGSLYHRFPSRDVLLARLWLRSIDRFQQHFLAALAPPEGGDLDEAAINAALQVLAWARGNMAEAQVLLLHRREDVAARWPDDLGAQLRSLNGRVEAAVRAHALRRYGSDDDEHLQRLTFALVDLPYAACRRYLGSGVPPPAALDGLVADAARSVLAD